MALMRSNFWFTIIWTMIFILFFAYFFVTSSIVALEDGFDETVKQKGYPEDFEKASGWDKFQYLVWALSWIPEKNLKQIKKALKTYGYKDDDSDSDEDNAEGADAEGAK